LVHDGEEKKFSLMPVPSRRENAAPSTKNRNNHHCLPLTVWEIFEAKIKRYMPELFQVKPSPQQALPQQGTFLCF
jgi:hypothetical protein